MDIVRRINEEEYPENAVNLDKSDTGKLNPTKTSYVNMDIVRRINEEEYPEDAVNLDKSDTTKTPCLDMNITQNDSGGEYPEDTANLNKSDIGKLNPKTLCLDTNITQNNSGGEYPENTANLDKSHPDKIHTNGSHPDKNGHYEKYLSRMSGIEPDFSKSERSNLTHPQGIQYYFIGYTRFLVDIPETIHFFDADELEIGSSGWALIENFNSKNRMWLEARLIETKKIREANKQKEITVNKQKETRLKKTDVPYDFNATYYYEETEKVKRVSHTRLKLRNLGIMFSYSVINKELSDAIDHQLTKLRIILEQMTYEEIRLEMLLKLNTRDPHREIDSPEETLK